MAFVPNQQLTVRDPGLGLAPSAASTFVFFGTSSHGPKNAIRYYTTKGQVLDTLGQGPLSEALCYYLTVAGGPAIGIRVDHDGNEGDITNGTPVRVKTSVGTVTVAGVDDPATPEGPYDAYEGVIEITVKDSEFRYTLDGGTSWSPSLVIPDGGTFLIPNTGLEAEFESNTGPIQFDAGDRFPFSTTANHYDVEALADAVEALEEATDEFAVVVLTGEEADTADGATMFAALSTHLQGFANGFRYVGALMSAGTPAVSEGVIDFAEAKDDFLDSVDSRIGVCFAGVRQVSQKPFTGWGVPRRPLTDVVAGRAGASLISTHLGRFASGSLPGVVALEYDEYKAGQGMSAAKFIVSRTWPGAGGFFINRGNLRSPVGSDFDLWPRRRIMDVACDVTQKALQPFMNTKIRVLKDGTGRIDPVAAKRIETVVNNALRAALLSPKDAEGNQGHVAAASYRVDLSNNVLLTNKVQGSVAIVPDPYAEEIVTDLGFAAQAE